MGRISLDAIPHINTQVSSSSLEDDLKSICKLVRPQWNLKELKTKEFNDGITNRLIGLYTGESFDACEVVMVRIYGDNTAILIDRHAELRNLLILKETNMAGEVYAKFHNGLCYEFRHGFVADDDIIRHPKYMRLIAKEFARLHCLQLEEYKELFPHWKQPILFPTLRKWLNLLPHEFSNPEKNERFKSFPSLNKLQEELVMLERCLPINRSPVVFSHNDTLIKNLILSQNRDRIYLIDFEYADFNYEAFDIGNHFAEFAGVDEFDMSKYPDRQFQLRWLRNYLYYRNFYASHFSEDPDKGRLMEGDIIDPSIDEQELECLYQDVQKFAIVSHLFWSIWAVLQSRFSNIDFDYLSYALARWNEFNTRKHLLQ
jgi:ethanolamine kinase